MIWTLLFLTYPWWLVVSPPGTPDVSAMRARLQPIVVEPPESMLPENWDILRCFTGPGATWIRCHSSRYFDFDTAEAPSMNDWGVWCGGWSLSDPAEGGKHPSCITMFDYDRDLDIDLYDYAMWEAGVSIPPPFDPDAEVLRFCRHDRCWFVMWFEDEWGNWTPCPVEIPMPTSTRYDLTEIGNTEPGD